jgi:hypothetical protein
MVEGRGKGDTATCCVQSGLEGVFADGGVAIQVPETVAAALQLLAAVLHGPHIAPLVHAQHVCKGCSAAFLDEVQCGGQVSRPQHPIAAMD